VSKPSIAPFNLVHSDDPNADPILRAKNIPCMECAETIFLGVMSELGETPGRAINTITVALALVCVALEKEPGSLDSITSNIGQQLLQNMQAMRATAGRTMTKQ
jgi:hypothetical protein